MYFERLLFIAEKSLFFAFMKLKRLKTRNLKKYIYLKQLYNFKKRF